MKGIGKHGLIINAISAGKLSFGLVISNGPVSQSGREKMPRTGYGVIGVGGEVERSMRN
jgi:hypothetical protein